MQSLPNEFPIHSLLKALSLKTSLFKKKKEREILKNELGIRQASWQLLGEIGIYLIQNANHLSRNGLELALNEIYQMK